MTESKMPKPIELISPSIEIDSKELGITLKTSPETLREIEELQQAQAVALALASRRIIFR